MEDYGGEKADKTESKKFREGGRLMDSLTLRNIKRSEIKEASKTMAECFKDYPLYVTFFPNEETRVRNLVVFYNASLTSRRSYTYVTEDLGFIGVIKRPNDKTRSAFWTYFNPIYLFKFLPLLNKKNYKLLRSYSENCDKLRAKNYDVENDVFIEAICIKKEKRRDIPFFEIFEKNYNGETVYAETADDRLVYLYKRLGFKITEETVWNGVKNYALKKNGKND